MLLSMYVTGTTVVLSSPPSWIATYTKLLLRMYAGMTIVMGFHTVVLFTGSNKTALHLKSWLEFAYLSYFALQWTNNIRDFLRADPTCIPGFHTFVSSTFSPPAVDSEILPLGASALSHCNVSLALFGLEVLNAWLLTAISLASIVEGISFLSATWVWFVRKPSYPIDGKDDASDKTVSFDTHDSQKDERLTAFA